MAATVARLGSTVLASCPLCEQPATWAIGPTERSCTRCLGQRMEDLHAADPHPFHPYLPTPLRRGNW